MRAPRVLFVDVLRLIALLQMVNGHTLHAVLDSGVRHGELYQGYLFFRGLVSVAFMLAAGFAFYLTSVLRPDAMSGQARRKRVLRALEIIAIGFLLRLPLSALLHAEPSALRAALTQVLRVDVLPCIGVTLLLLEGLSLLWRGRRTLALACSALTIAAAWLPGWTAGLSTQLPLGILTTWLGPQGGSAFPLLPYAGFVFAGVSAAAFALPLGAATPAAQVARRLGAIGVGLGLVSVLLSRIPSALLPPAREGVHTPGFFMLKLALVLIGCSFLALGLRRVRALPKLLSILAAETLGIYVFHLFVLYGAPLALATRVGPVLSVPAALSFSIALIVSSGLFGLGFRMIKAWPFAQRCWPATRGVAIVVASVWAVSLLSPAVGGAARKPKSAVGGEQDACARASDVIAFPGKCPVRSGGG